MKYDTPWISMPTYGMAHEIMTWQAASLAYSTSPFKAKAYIRNLSDFVIQKYVFPTKGG